jgi:hypothetical protein
VNEVGCEAGMLKSMLPLCARALAYIPFARTVQSIMTMVCLASLATAEAPQINWLARAVRMAMTFEGHA